MKKSLSLMLGVAIIMVCFIVGTEPTNALTVSPPTFTYEDLNPGDTVLDVLKIENESPEPLTIYPIVKNFTSDKAESGEPQFYGAEENVDGTALAKWITLDPKPITLEPKQKANLPFSINVPKDGAQPGGHYGAILLSTGSPEEGGKVGIISQLGVLILVRVSGEVREAAAIAEFGFKEKRLWYDSLPVDFFLRFENDGNTHLRPIGSVLITDMFGRRVATVSVNEEMRSVLPRSIRKFEFGWRKAPTPDGEGFLADLHREWRNFAIGKFRAQLVVNYGRTNQLLSEEREFSVWPWKLMTVFGAGVLLVILLFATLMRSHNKAVIRKYELHKRRDANSFRKNKEE